MITLRKFLQVLGMLSLMTLVAAWQQGNFPPGNANLITTLVTVGSGGSITPTGTGTITATHALDAVGPVINAQTLGASPTLADNATAFAAASAAANAAAYVSVGTPTIRSTGKTAIVVGITSATQAVAISAGDTVIVGILSAAPTGITFTISDGVNNYYPISIVASPVANNNQAAQLFGTVPGLAKAFSGTLTVTASGSANFGFIVLDAFNVGSYSQVNLITSSPSTNTPTVTAQTQDANNIIASWFMYQSNTITVSAGTGNLQQSFTGPANDGGGLVTNSSVPFNTALTTSAALSGGTPWVMNGIELRSVKTAVPTVYIPVGYYTYSSGLSFTHPVTLKGEPGSTLCYTGIAHAVDMGPSGLVIADGDAYTVDEVRFECGAGMTQGIFFANNAILIEVKNSHFYNFGNLTSAAIFSNGNTQGMSIKNNHLTIWEGPPPTLNGGVFSAPGRIFVDLTANAQFSTLTLENNYAFCASGRVNGGVGCGTYLAPFIRVAGYAGIIANNSFAGGFCPWVQLVATGTGPYGTKIIGNDFEVDSNGCYAIQYAGLNDGLKVLGNYFNNKAQTPTSMLGPLGNSLLVNTEVSNNIATNQPLNIPLIAQPNLAGQTGNIGWHNTCSTGGGSGTTPCALLHTLGGNINQWNNDYGGTCTMVAGVCPTYTFLVAYAVAPKCTASWTGAGLFTGVLQVIPTTTTLIVKDLIGTDTGVMNWSCNPDAQ